nr:MAG TPA: hypothetical protein [Caudoviricetes sp.]
MTFYYVSFIIKSQKRCIVYFRKRGDLTCSIK